MREKLLQLQTEVARIRQSSLVYRKGSVESSRKTEAKITEEELLTLSGNPGLFQNRV